MRRITIGVGMKMYFDRARATVWLRDVAEIGRRHPGVTDGSIRLFVLPSFVMIRDAVDQFAGSAIAVGAQDLFWEDRGAFTGEVSGLELAQSGARLVETGHAERRGLFGETPAIVAAKTSAALRNGLTPILCVGEIERVDPQVAAEYCRTQTREALRHAAGGAVVLAYEPVWAIGADAPAPVDHIRAVTAALRDSVDDDRDRAGSAVIYGGTAGPGLLSELGSAVDGLFLGRFAHDPAALEQTLDEAFDLIRKELVR